MADMAASSKLQTLVVTARILLDANIPVVLGRWITVSRWYHRSRPKMPLLLVRDEGMIQHLLLFLSLKVGSLRFQA